MPAIDKTNPGLFAADVDLKFEALMWDVQREIPLPGSYINSLKLTLVDTLTQSIINGINKVDILNKDRGRVDEAGNLVITLGPADTAIHAGTPLVQRSMVIDFSYNSGQTLGRHQFNFRLTNLVAP